MKDYLSKLAQMKSDIVVIQDALFFEMYNLKQKLSKRDEVILEMAEALDRITRDVALSGYAGYLPTNGSDIAKQCITKHAETINVIKQARSKK